MAGYTYPGKKTTYNGIDFDSILEVRFYKLLEQANSGLVIYCHHWVKLVIDGKETFRQIDFVTKPAIKIKWADGYYFAYEVKGCLTEKDYIRKHALKDAGWATFIVTQQLIEYYETYGMLSKPVPKLYKKRNEPPINI